MRLLVSGEEVHVNVAARSFLMHQVRSIVGSLAHVNSHQLGHEALYIRNPYRRAVEHRSQRSVVWFCLQIFIPMQSFLLAFESCRIYRLVSENGHPRTLKPPYKQAVFPRPHALLLSVQTRPPFVASHHKLLHEIISIMNRS